jgi:hypothetical protein
MRGRKLILNPSPHPNYSRRGTQKQCVPVRRRKDSVNLFFFRLTSLRERGFFGNLCHYLNQPFQVIITTLIPQTPPSTNSDPRGRR